MVALPVAVAIAMAAAAAASAAGAIVSSQAQADQLDYQKDVAKQEGEQAQREAAAEEAAIRRKALFVRGQQEAGFAASGVSLEGSPLAALEDTAVQSELDALSARYQTKQTDIKQRAVSMGRAMLDGVVPDGLDDLAREADAAGLPEVATALRDGREDVGYYKDLKPLPPDAIRAAAERDRKRAQGERDATQVERFAGRAKDADTLPADAEKKLAAELRGEAQDAIQAIAGGAVDYPIDALVARAEKLGDTEVVEKLKGAREDLAYARSLTGKSIDELFGEAAKQRQEATKVDPRTAERLARRAEHAERLASSRSTAVIPSPQPPPLSSSTDGAGPAVYPGGPR